MKNSRLPLLASVSALLLSGVSAFAGVTDYQVTGPVLSVTDTSIVVEFKGGKEHWEIARNADTKVTGGDLKVGDKVTVHYTMTAGSVENKGVATAKTGAAKADKTADAASPAMKAPPAEKKAPAAKP